ncbi:uncharacterized protein LOC131550797 [Onychostoma macrolepis]|uniref:uncharacterized protein LOC131550797 n=1 Tax=Onychostoma macrolepis TaxID=369639 RepID=UPI00272B505D|nr:uncharacterized protein LOC131550797 [Onychostoma macrolepis]
MFMEYLPVDPVLSQTSKGRTSCCAARGFENKVQTALQRVLRIRPPHTQQAKREQPWKTPPVTPEGQRLLEQTFRVCVRLPRHGRDDSFQLSLSFALSCPLCQQGHMSAPGEEAPLTASARPAGGVTCQPCTGRPVAVSRCWTADYLLELCRKATKIKRKKCLRHLCHPVNLQGPVRTLQVKLLKITEADKQCNCKCHAKMNKRYTSLQYSQQW